MPGGDTRAIAFFSPYPVMIERGEGVFVWDVDGNRYVDMTQNFSSVVHGHAYPPIVEAVQRQVRNGTAFAACSPQQIDLAELLVQRVASVERVRFCNSGTEAAILAMRIARLATGRRKIVMARYGFHGQLHELETGSQGK